MNKKQGCVASVIALSVCTHGYSVQLATVSAHCQNQGEPNTTALPISLHRARTSLLPTQITLREGDPSGKSESVAYSPSGSMEIPCNGEQLYAVAYDCAPGIEVTTAFLQCDELASMMPLRCVEVASVSANIDIPAQLQKCLIQATLRVAPFAGLDGGWSLSSGELVATVDPATNIAVWPAVPVGSYVLSVNWVHQGGGTPTMTGGSGWNRIGVRLSGAEASRIVDVRWVSESRCSVKVVGNGVQEGCSWSIWRGEIYDSQVMWIESLVVPETPYPRLVHGKVVVTRPLTAGTHVLWAGSPCGVVPTASVVPISDTGTDVTIVLDGVLGTPLVVGAQDGKGRELTSRVTVRSRDGTVLPLSPIWKDELGLRIWQGSSWSKVHSFDPIPEGEYTVACMLPNGKEYAVNCHVVRKEGPICVVVPCTQDAIVR